MTITMSEDKIAAGVELVWNELVTNGANTTPEMCDALIRKLQAVWQDTEISMNVKDIVDHANKLFGLSPDG